MIRVGRIAVKICGGDGLGMVWESSRPIQVIACGLTFGNRYFLFVCRAISYFARVPHKDYASLSNI